MFSKRSEGKPVIVADISDNGCSVALVFLKKERPAEVALSLRTTLPIEERTPEQTVSAVQEVFKNALTKIIETASKTYTAPTALHVIVRAPWTQFRTSHAMETFSEPRSITKDTIADLAKKALSEPSNLNRASILEAGVLQVFLNGYPTTQPIGKRAREAMVVAFESDIDPVCKTMIQQVSGVVFPGRVPIIRSGMRSLITVMQEHLPDAHRYVLIDIGGNSSACAIVRKDEITQYASVHEGLSSIVRRITGTGLPEETLSLMRMLATDACSTTACQTLKDSIAKAEPELVRAFGEVFAALASTRKIPNKTMLAAPTELIPWLEGFFSRIDFSQFTATTQPLVVETLSPEHLIDTTHWRVGVVPDTTIGISASSVNILEHVH